MSTTESRPTARTSPRIAAERDRIRAAHLKPAGERPASTARGLHHTALISSDVETTVRFYQDVLGFPLTELIENRDYPGLLALLLRHRQRQPAGLLRLPRPRRRARTPRCSAGCTTWRSASTPSAGRRWSSGSPRPASQHEVHSGVSVYFRDPDGARIELIADPLGEMYGQHVL